jgi:hypothetical protein
MDNQLFVYGSGMKWDVALLTCQSIVVKGHALDLEVYIDFTKDSK